MSIQQCTELQFCSASANLADDKTKEREVREGENARTRKKRPQIEVVLVPGASGGGHEASLNWSGCCSVVKNHY